MDNAHQLQRFVTAQDRVFGTVLAELRAGRKRTHWMWFVFPQLAGLGYSEMARTYALADAEEARAYLAHPILGPRLLSCTTAVLGVETGGAHAIFGSPDDLKFHSCMTLFAAVAPEQGVFRDALGRFFEGARDARTLGLLGGR